MPAAPILLLDQTDSTNADARRRADAGETGPLWIVARRQTEACAEPRDLIGLGLGDLVGDGRPQAGDHPAWKGRSGGVDGHEAGVSEDVSRP